MTNDVATPIDGGQVFRCNLPWLDTVLIVSDPETGDDGDPYAFAIDTEGLAMRPPKEMLCEGTLSEVLEYLPHLSAERAEQARQHNERASENLRKLRQ